MKCHITDIIAHTTAAMGMAPTPPPILPDVCHCATDISKMIKMKLLEVATEAVLKADAVMLVTEWRQFRVPSWEKVKESMKTPLIIDGRNIYDGNELEDMGFTYYCIGKEPNKL